MRVVLVSHLALPHIGGVETLVDLEIRALAEAGHDVVLITSDGQGKGAAPCYPAAVRVIRVPAWHGLERYCRLPYPIFAPGLLGHLWRETGRCDILHVHGFLFMNCVLALVIGWLRGRRRILTDHGGIQRFDSWFVSGLARMAVETLGRLSARLATRRVSYNTRVVELLDRLGGGEEATRFLPNPIDWTRFSPPTRAQHRAARNRLGWETDRPKVLFIGRLLPEKGVSILLAARDPAYDLVFCGPGDRRQLGDPLPPGVEYLPPRPPEELVSLYHAADLLVVPSGMREGFPLVIQEGLACSLPVITCHDPGYGPYRHLGCLRVCDREPEAIRDAIREALAAHRNDSREEGLRGVRELFPQPDDWLERLYGELAEEVMSGKTPVGSQPVDRAEGGPSLV